MKRLFGVYIIVVEVGVWASASAMFLSPLAIVLL